MIRPTVADVDDFERAFAQRFGASDAVAFAYGRSAQWAFLRALDIAAADVVMPAYTCSVVAHAVTLSGNRPVFVDISLTDYNATPERVAAAITPATRAVIATNTFGYPQDADGLRQVIADAEARYDHKIWFIQDCAHAFGASTREGVVATTGDVALFGLNISKIISSIFGGMLTFTDPELAGRVRAWRDRELEPSTIWRELRHRLYGVAATVALSPTGVRATDALLRRTRLLDRWASSYHLDDRISFPPDHAITMTRIAASVGLQQLDRYDAIVERRRTNAVKYATALVVGDADVKGPLVDGATYSHYVVRVPDRSTVVERWRVRGVQLGELIQYSVPHLHSYLGPQAPGFDNSLHASRHLVNFPVDAAPSDVDRIIAMSRE